MTEQGPAINATPQRDSSVEDFMILYADALIAGDTRTVAAMWESPALVMDDESVTYVSCAFEAERFFSAARERYVARGVVTAYPEVLREAWATERLVVADILWRKLDAQGEEVGCEASTYMMRRGDDGDLKLHVVVARGASDTPSRAELG